MNAISESSSVSVAIPGKEDVFSACQWMCGKILGRQRQISAELK